MLAAMPAPLAALALAASMKRRRICGTSSCRPMLPSSSSASASAARHCGRR
jgi:hypothetical protein